MNPLHIGTDDFLAFAKALREAEPLVARELRTRLRAAGEVVAAQARTNAAEFSRSIPASVKVRIQRNDVIVEGGVGGVVIAGLFEVGDNSPGSSSWRHPVFGDTNVWVEQDTHPWLQPAVDSNLETATAAAQAALDAAVDEAVKL